MSQVSLVFIAHEFQQFGIRKQLQMKCNHPGPCLSFDVIDPKRDVQMAHITPLVAFNNAEGFRCGMTSCIESRFSIEPSRIDH
jgi:hypothetical protein